MNQNYTVSDIQLALVNGDEFAALTLTPPAPSTLPFNPMIGNISQPQTLRVTGLLPADIAGISLRDTVQLAITKVTE